jgi:hypothetical protein
MRLRVIIAVGAVLVIALLWMRDLADAPPSPPRVPRARPARAPRSGRVDTPASTRNVFEFAPRSAPEAPRRPAIQATVEAPPALPATDPPVRFVGLVRRGGTLKAALQVHGEAAVLGMGEAAGGYTVVGIDDDGIRLRAADGTILTLAAGGS